MSLTITPTYEQIQVVQNQNNVIQVSAQGPVGPGVPTGGIAGQYLRKQSAADYDATWANIVIGEVTGLSAALAALQPLNASLTQISGLTFAANDLIQYVGGVLTNRTPAQVKASLAITTGDVSGLGTMAVQNASAVAITGGSIDGTTIGATTATTGRFSGGASVGVQGTSGSNAGVSGTSSTSAGINGLSTNQYAGYFSRNTASPTGNTAVLGVLQDHASDTNPAALIRTDGTGDILRLSQGSDAGVLWSVAASGLQTSKRLDSGTNDTQNVLILGRNSSGTPAANFASSFVFQLKTSTTPDQNAASIVTSWVVATHASYTTRQVHNIYDAGGAREAFRIEASGSAPMIGFLGAAAVIRQALGAWAGLTDAQRITALRDALTNLGLTSYT